MCQVWRRRRFAPSIIWRASCACGWKSTEKDRRQASGVRRQTQGSGSRGDDQELHAFFADGSDRTDTRVLLVPVILRAAISADRRTYAPFGSADAARE